jgi:hypothetical protein
MLDAAYLFSRFRSLTIRTLPFCFHNFASPTKMCIAPARKQGAVSFAPAELFRPTKTQATGVSKRLPHELVVQTTNDDRLNEPTITVGLQKSPISTAGRLMPPQPLAIFMEGLFQTTPGQIRIVPDNAPSSCCRLTKFTEHRARHCDNRWNSDRSLSHCMPSMPRRRSESELSMPRMPRRSVGE